ncbi:tagaturonate reductase [Chitinophagaceae bacterium LB-8]|uniref:Tagaturonate reductase n=1 Tax=Paraflavisolibacter caeni TaxID=2982496 RepID=A0A9X3BFG2_9BACT|nr:tagaturonate reductase [Paraflavisolibacter caeni]MCU7548769.1 tagaturonate reductase [Paraflavisolibacter caeni]
MTLSSYNIKNIIPGTITVPDEDIFELPEKVLQFGTGVFMRGMPDYIIDKANRQGVFNGRIVVVKSTKQGTTTDFNKQDGLYTVCVRGMLNGELIEENVVNSSISRVLTASKEWPQILECAHNQALQVVISNTTEVGIQLVQEDIRQQPPVSFPGKLLAFLYERYHAFNGSERSGLVIVPTELISDNGKKLESIVLELAHLNGLEDDFIEWLETSNRFCNSLVDCMVPGKPDAATQTAIEEELGCKDQLMVLAEAYRLWAIEGDDYVRSVLSFAKADEGVIIEPDIELYRELKLRLLNGAHTLGCAPALLAGYETVNEAMADETFSALISNLLHTELVPAIQDNVNNETAKAFAASVLDRFRNPYIHFNWSKVALQFSTKMKVRCMPVLLQHYKVQEAVPEAFSLCLAAYIQFLRGIRKSDHKYYAKWNGNEFLFEDDMAAGIYKKCQELKPTELVESILGNNGFWSEDLNLLPGFYASVLNHLNSIEQYGVKEVVRALVAKRELV